MKAEWKCDGKDIFDQSALIFSPRRKEISDSFKIMVDKSSPAICGKSGVRPVFGGSENKYIEIEIIKRSDINKGSNVFLRYSYKCSGNSFFASILCTNWLTNEIEVYQIEK